MHSRTKVRPTLESLESKTLLSGVTPTVLHPTIAAEVSAAASTAITLSGTEYGSFVGHKSGGKEIYSLYTGGTLQPVGASAINGSLGVSTSVSSGPPNGTITIYAAKGTLTLQVPQSVDLPAGLPTATSKNMIVDTYVITKGTGAYKGDTGSGVIAFTLKQTASAGGYSVGTLSIGFTTLKTTT